MPSFAGSAFRQFRASRWVARLVAEGLSAARINKLHVVLSACLAAAAAEGLVPRNPARHMELPRVVTARRRFLSADEVHRLADAMPDHESRVFVLDGAYGRLRFGELAGLRRSRCHPLRRRLVIDRALSDVRGRVSWKAPKSHTVREPCWRFTVP